MLFNDLSPLKDSLQNKVINKAIIKFDVVDGYPENFGPHNSLSILRKDSNKTFLFIQRQVTVFIYLGISYTQKGDNN